jgi:hypothetical protein
LPQEIKEFYMAKNDEYRVYPVQSDRNGWPDNMTVAGYEMTQPYSEEADDFPDDESAEPQA